LRALEASWIRHRPVFPEEKLLGTVAFVGESSAPLDSLIGDGLDARMYSDLSPLSGETPLLPTEKFYVRTRASELLDGETPWRIEIGGRVDKPAGLTLADLKSLARPVGLHLMECAGNTRSTRFGLLSVADWTGVPIADVLDTVRAKAEGQRIMVAGFDTFPGKAVTSLPGADWIFTRQDLETSQAFLATEMNHKPLSKDHGAPVRLVVPGWYGCTCIKWVNAILFVDNDAAATSQMQEFAGRTHQAGMPSLAKEYRPAKIDQAAMPIRVEKWVVGGRIKYRVIGILWGGAGLIRVLEIRFNPEEEYVPVDSFKQTANDPWSFWSHEWLPKTPGRYTIRLRVKDPPISTRRLGSGHYARSLEIDEV
jgi:DMSO/TMAO reductase YedYZ molybdopterin-dependent catalytic subunit